ncbi:MAG: hypothetical protein ABSD02_10685 [Steroidobacteraceae bacterium]|jgi:hypothetical protein
MSGDTQINPGRSQRTPDPSLREVIEEFARLLEVLGLQLGQSVKEAEREWGDMGSAFHRLAVANDRVRKLASSPMHSALAEQSAEIGASLETAVVTLQCHDRLAQRVGHICAGLDSLHTLLRDGVERPNQEWLRLLREVERRQHAEQARLAAADIAPRGSVELF